MKVQLFLLLKDQLRHKLLRIYLSKKKINSNWGQHQIGSAPLTGALGKTCKEVVEERETIIWLAVTLSVALLGEAYLGVWDELSFRSHFLTLRHYWLAFWFACLSYKGTSTPSVWWPLCLIHLTSPNSNWYQFHTCASLASDIQKSQYTWASKTKQNSKIGWRIKQIVHLCLWVVLLQNSTNTWPSQCEENILQVFLWTRDRPWKSYCVVITVNKLKIC